MTAGVLSLDDALKLVAGRAQLMADKCVPRETGMLAVKLSPGNLAQMLAKDERFSELSVACHNRFVVHVSYGITG